jgi:hypothetical protein
MKMKDLVFQSFLARFVQRKKWRGIVHDLSQRQRKIRDFSEAGEAKAATGTVLDIRQRRLLLWL